MDNHRNQIEIGVILKNKTSGMTKMVTASAISSYPGKPEELTYFFYDNSTVPSNWEDKFDYIGKVKIN